MNDKKIYHSTVDKFIFLLRNIETFFSLIEKYALIVIISFIVLLSFGSIVLRNAGVTIPPWVNDILQQGVLCVAFIGGSLASRYNKQVSFNFLFPILENRPTLKRIINAATNLYVIPIAVLLFICTYNFVRLEKEWGMDIPSLGMDTWYFETVLVYVFAMISFKYFVRFLEAARGIPFPEDKEDKKEGGEGAERILP